MSEAFVLYFYCGTPVKLPYLAPSVPRMAMVSNKEFPRSLAHADHMVARFVQTQQKVIAITCKRSTRSKPQDDRGSGVTAL